MKKLAKQTKRAKLVNVEYVPSDTIEHQGTRESIEKYLKRGYYIKESRNGYWLLCKSTRVMAIFRDSDGELYKYDIKNGILEYYSKQRISKKMTDKFCQEARDGKIKFKIDERSSLLIF